MGEECTALKEMPISLWILPDSKYSCEEEEETYRERETERARNRKKGESLRKGVRSETFSSPHTKKAFDKKINNSG